MFLQTRLCNIYKKGNCRFGPACQFAHGTAELRGLPDNTDMVIHFSISIHRAL